MKRNYVVLLATAAALIMTTFTVISAEENRSEARSIAWYVANLGEANKQNRLCYDNPSMQSTADCVNALHALEISFKNGNRVGERISP